MKKTILLIVFLTSTFYLFSQDIIIRKNGEQIHCKITKTDSTTIYFSMNRDGNDINTSINRNDVQAINFETKQTVSNPVNKPAIEDEILNNNRISISVGPSFAEGNFGSTDHNETESGFAGTGVNLNLYFTHKINPNFGIGVKGFTNSNVFKSASYVTELQMESGYPWVTNSSYWNSDGLMAGIIGYIPSGKSTFELSLLGGYMSLSSPETKFTLANTIAWFQLESTKATSFGCNLGVGINCPLSENWSFLANLDYLMGSFKFGNMRSTDFQGTNEVSPGGKQTFDALNLTIGLGYNF